MSAVLKEEPFVLTSRQRRQLDLEMAIITFLPDYDEACELLDALMGALERRVGSSRMVVVDEEARALRVAIKEAEPCELSTEDLVYDLGVQRKVDGE